MATSAVAPAGKLMSSLKGIGGKLGAVAGKVADSKAVSWAGEQVRKVVVPDQIIKGWQDVYKGWKTADGGARTVRTVRVIRDPGSLTRAGGQAAKIGGGAAKTAGKATRGAASAARTSGVANAGKAVRAARNAQYAANGAKGAVLRDGTKIAGGVKKIEFPGGFREVTKVKVTKAELVGKAAKAVKAGKVTRGGAGLKAVKGTHFKLAGSGNGGETVKGLARKAGSRATGAGRGARSAGDAVKAAKAAKAAKSAKGAAGAAKGAKGLKGAARGAAGKGGKVVETTTRTITRSTKGFKKPFGMAAFKAGLKNIFQGALKAAKVSGIVAAIISVLENGYGVLSGQLGVPEALGGIVRDTAAGFVAGGAAAVFSGGVLAVVGGLGLTAGLPIFLIGLAASLAGYALFNAIFNAVIGDRLKGFVQHLLGG